MPIFLTSRKLLNRAVWSQRHTWYQIKSPGVRPASDLLFTDQTKISVRVLFQGNDLRDWSLYIFGREGEGGGSWERVIDFLENWVPMNCQWGGGGRGGVMKRFQNFSGDQVNFMVKIKILRPPPGSCNFVAFEKFTRAYWHQSALDIMLLPLLMLFLLYLLVLTKFDFP